MRKISGSVFFLKKIFPFVWFGFLGFFVVMNATVSQKPNGPPFLLFLFPVLMGGVGFFIFRKFLFDLADEVYDCGTFLLVRLNKTEEKIFFSNIKNVNYTTYTNPQRITLSLRQAGLLGKEVSFMPPRRFRWIFNPDPLIEELIDRVDQARQLK